MALSGNPKVKLNRVDTIENSVAAIGTSGDGSLILKVSSVTFLESRNWFLTIGLQLRTPENISTSPSLEAGGQLVADSDRETQASSGKNILTKVRTDVVKNSTQPNFKKETFVFTEGTERQDLSYSTFFIKACSIEPPQPPQPASVAEWGHSFLPLSHCVSDLFVKRSWAAVLRLVTKKADGSSKVMGTVQVNITYTPTQAYSTLSVPKQPKRRPQVQDEKDTPDEVDGRQRGMHPPSANKLPIGRGGAGGGIGGRRLLHPQGVEISPGTKNSYPHTAAGSSRAVVSSSVWAGAHTGPPPTTLEDVSAITVTTGGSTVAVSVLAVAEDSGARDKAALLCTDTLAPADTLTRVNTLIRANTLSRARLGTSQIAVHPEEEIDTGTDPAGLGASVGDGSRRGSGGGGGNAGLGTNVHSSHDSDSRRGSLESIEEGDRQSSGGTHDLNPDKMEGFFGHKINIPVPGVGLSKPMSTPKEALGRRDTGLIESDSKSHVQASRSYSNTFLSNNEGNQTFSGSRQGGPQLSISTSPRATPEPSTARKRAEKDPLSVSPKGVGALSDGNTGVIESSPSPSPIQASPRYTTKTKSPLSSPRLFSFSNEGSCVGSSDEDTPWQFMIHLHGVDGLPPATAPKSLSTSTPVGLEPFVSIKTETEAKSRLPAKLATSQVKTGGKPYALWDSLLTLTVPDGQVEREERILFTIADVKSKKIICKFFLPCKRLIENYQYDLKCSDTRTSAKPAAVISRSADKALGYNCSATSLSLEDLNKANDMGKPGSGLPKPSGDRPVSLYLSITAIPPISRSNQLTAQRPRLEVVTSSITNITLLQKKAGVNLKYSQSGNLLSKELLTDSQSINSAAMSEDGASIGGKIQTVMRFVADASQCLRRSIRKVRRGAHQPRACNFPEASTLKFAESSDGTDDSEYETGTHAPVRPSRSLRNRLRRAATTASPVLKTKRKFPNDPKFVSRTGALISANSVGEMSQYCFFSLPRTNQREEPKMNIRKAWRRGRAHSDSRSGSDSASNQDSDRSTAGPLLRASLAHALKHDFPNEDSESEGFAISDNDDEDLSMYISWSLVYEVYHVPANRLVPSAVGPGVGGFVGIDMGSISDEDTNPKADGRTNARSLRWVPNTLLGVGVLPLYTRGIAATNAARTATLYSTFEECLERYKTVASKHRPKESSSSSESEAEDDESANIPKSTISAFITMSLPTQGPGGAISVSTPALHSATQSPAASPNVWVSPRHNKSVSNWELERRRSFSSMLGTVEKNMGASSPLGFDDGDQGSLTSTGSRFNLGRHTDYLSTTSSQRSLRAVHSATLSGPSTPQLRGALPYHDVSSQRSGNTRIAHGHNISPTVRLGPSPSHMKSRGRQSLSRIQTKDLMDHQALNSENDLTESATSTDDDTVEKKYRSIIQDMKQQLLMKDDIIYDKDNLISRLRDTIAMLRETIASHEARQTDRR